MEVAMHSLSSKYEFRIRWEPYLLKPETPPDGFPIPPAYSDPNNPRIQHMRQVASSLGINFNLSRKKFANTLMGHALLEYALTVDDGAKQDDVAEKLFKRCFTDAESLQEDTILSVAKECGFDLKQVKAYVSDENNLKNVMEKAMNWSAKGISGVPTFYMNGQKMFSGAQEPEVFQRMFEVAAEKFPVTTSSKS